EQRIPQGGRIKVVDLHKPSGAGDDVALEELSGRISDGVFDTPQFFPALWGEPGQFRNEVPARDPSNIIFSILGLFVTGGRGDHHIVLHAETVHPTFVDTVRYVRGLPHFVTCGQVVRSDRLLRTNEPSFTSDATQGIINMVGSKPVGVIDLDQV